MLNMMMNTQAPQRGVEEQMEETAHRNAQQQEQQQKTDNENDAGQTAHPPSSSSASPAPSSSSSSSSSIPLSSLFFTSGSSVPAVAHTPHFTLSHNDCVVLGLVTHHLLSYYSSDARYASLRSLFQFICKLHQHQLIVKEKHHTAIQSVEKSMQGQLSLFTQQQTKQLMTQIKALSYLCNGQHLPEQVKASLAAFNHRQASTTHPLLQELTNSQGRGGSLSDPCAALIDSLSVKLSCVPANAQLLAEQRHSLVTRQMQAKLNALNEYAARVPANGVNSLSSKSVLFARRCFSLCDLQRRVRLSVLSCIPADVVSLHRYRTPKEIEQEQKKRERIRRLSKVKEERSSRRARRVYLTSVLNHSREFVLWHREKRRLIKRNAEAVNHHLSELEKLRLLESKSAERERLAALKENNEEEYMRLLKKAKNERLLILMRQTDQYMKTIGQHIQQEQQKRRDIAQVHTSNQQNMSDVTGEQQDQQQQEKAIAANLSVHQPPVSTSPSSAPDDELDELMFSRQRYYSLAHSITETVHQPRSMVHAGQLRSYQLHGLQWLISLYNNQLNGILADEMGLGKTVQTCALLAYLMEVKQNYGPFLIIVPMSTLHNNWEFEFDRWLPCCAKVIYDGNREQRKAIRHKYLQTRNYNVLMTTFEFAMRDKVVLRQIPWEYIIIDEAHRLKNPKCKLALELATYPTTSRRVALTGTPLQNELPELWSLLNFLHPTIFNSCENFEKWFSSPFAALNAGGAANKEERDKVTVMTEEEKLLVINRLHALLRPFMLRREKKEVERDLADKVEKVLRCELTPVQRLLYSSIISGSVSMHNRMVQLRKVCNHPYLFHPYIRGSPAAVCYPMDEQIVSICAKFTLLDSILTKLYATQHRVLLFSQMTRTMDILEDYCRLRAYRYLRLDGSTPTSERTEALQLFNAPDSQYFLFMLSTKAGGLGLNLQSADTVILFDSDWNPQNDLQAQARAHRIGQKQQVIVLRLITSSTIEEKVLAAANQKLNHEAMVIQAGMFHEHYSQSESRTMVERAMRVQIEGEEEDIADDDEVCKALARTEEELHLFTHMQRRRSSPSPPPSTHNLVPVWVKEWCLLGNRATSSEQTLVPYSVNNSHSSTTIIIDAVTRKPRQIEREDEESESPESPSDTLTPSPSPTPIPTPTRAIKRARSPSSSSSSSVFAISKKQKKLVIKISRGGSETAADTAAANNTRREEKQQRNSIPHNSTHTPARVSQTHGRIPKKPSSIVAINKRAM